MNNNLDLNEIFKDFSDTNEDFFAFICVLEVLHDYFADRDGCSVRYSLIKFMMLYLKALHGDLENEIADLDKYMLKEKEEN
jgi:hypothetical protein